MKKLFVIVLIFLFASCAETERLEVGHRFYYQRYYGVEPYYTPMYVHPRPIYIAPHRGYIGRRH
jgi:hypothetical protein